MRSLTFVAFLLTVLLPLPSPDIRAEPPRGKTPLAITDLYRLDSFHTPVLAPNGRRAACTRVWIDPNTKQERSAVWIIDARGDHGRPLEAGEPDGRAPVFSPDGKWLAFLSTRPRPEGWKQTPPTPPESDSACDIWLAPVAGGPAIPLAGPDKPYGRVFHDAFYGRVAFSPDGRSLVFVADGAKDPRTPEEKTADVYVVRPDQGEGYTGYGIAQIWLAHLDETPGKAAAARIERLTDDDVCYGDPHFSPDGRTLIVHANKTADREAVRYSINKNFDLYAIDPATKAQQQVTTGAGPEVSPRFSPDGKRLACLSVPRKGSHRDVFNLALVHLEPGGPRTEILFDQHSSGADRPPHPAPAFPLPEDCWDGDDHVVYATEAGIETHTTRVDVHSRKGSPLEPADMASMDSAAGRRRLRQQFSLPSNAFLKERALGDSRVLSWDSGGLRIEGILTMPPAEVARPPYKLIVYPHGGPHSRSVRGFDFTVQTFAAAGYAVLQPNFRGSSGYGQKFIDADRGDFGGGDMRDILSGIDLLVRDKTVDPDRQFIYGISYGGFLTCWLVTHTNRFRAAVAQNAVSDLGVMWGASDIPSWVEWEFGGRPWEVAGILRRHSPLTFSADVRTPTLILHSREDRRCPLAMGRLFYESLRSRGVPTQMVVYPGEGHAIRQPRHREDVLRRTLDWFARHDK
jgi:dipeptidyl aminopeptidase/acylaminoacyl peptidase